MKDLVGIQFGEGIQDEIENDNENENELGDYIDRNPNSQILSEEEEIEVREYNSKEAEI
jgi:hypothetical protein